MAKWKSPNAISEFRVEIGYTSPANLFEELLDPLAKETGGRLTDFGGCSNGRRDACLRFRSRDGALKCIQVIDSLKLSLTPLDLCYSYYED